MTVATANLVSLTRTVTQLQVAEAMTRVAQSVPITAIVSPGT